MNFKYFKIFLSKAKPFARYALLQILIKVIAGYISSLLF